MLRKAITAVALVLALAACKPAPGQTETFNYDNGYHEFQRTGSGVFVFGNTIKAPIKWTQCRWKVQRKLKGDAYWETSAHGDSSNAVMTVSAPSSTATRVRLHSSNCGKWSVKRRHK
jgi:hypothetical protein